VEDWVAILFNATFTLDDMACSSNICICAPVVDSSLIFLAFVGHESETKDLRMGDELTRAFACRSLKFSQKRSVVHSTFFCCCWSIVWYCDEFLMWWM
jgi:hypothetical protein